MTVHFGSAKRRVRWVQSSRSAPPPPTGTFTVLVSSGTSYLPTYAILNSAGTSFTVTQAVLSSNGTSYNPI